jgi:hypothetical protein
MATLQHKHRLAGTAVACISKIKPRHKKQHATSELGPLFVGSR